MNERMDQLELPPDLTLVRSEEAFSQFCFLQCEDAVLSRYYSVDDDVDIGNVEVLDGLCVDALQRVESWAGEPVGTVMHPLTAEVSVCSATSDGMTGSPSWCGGIAVYNEEGRSRFDADYRVRIIDRC
ncbi:MAG: hypothetical protein AAGA65_20040 [Actinomycetota bacterium]